MYEVRVEWVEGVVEVFEVEANELDDILEAYDIDEVAQLTYKEKEV